MDDNTYLKDLNTTRDDMVNIHANKAKDKLNKNKALRYIYIGGGIVSLILAFLGIIIPGLPVTPLALLSAILFAKSSDRLYNWLLNNKLLGPRIKNYQKNKGITSKGKIGVIAFMTAMVLFSSFVVVKVIFLRIVILSLGIIGGFVVWFFVPTAQKKSNDSLENDNHNKLVS
ncbi:MAG: YbaN family protein [Dysgonamonadaceae bacterium]|jgi:hypothetical protein|nr:YbaN family protein [Dysgonamonadaceae bacterium]